MQEHPFFTSPSIFFGPQQIDLTENESISDFFYIPIFLQSKTQEKIGLFLIVESAMPSEEIHFS